MLLVVATLTVPAASSHADVATITVDTRHVVLPMVTDAALQMGYVERDPARRAAALTILVEPIAEETGWTLFIRAEQAATGSGSTALSRGDVSWKFDHEHAAAYRSLADQEWVVLDRPMGGRAEVAIDLLVGLDWLNAPGRYRTSLSLTVRPR